MQKDDNMSNYIRSVRHKINGRVVEVMDDRGTTLNQFLTHSEFDILDEDDLNDVFEELESRLGERDILKQTGQWLRA